MHYLILTVSLSNFNNNLHTVSWNIKKKWIGKTLQHSLLKERTGGSRALATGKPQSYPYGCVKIHKLNYPKFNKNQRLLTFWRTKRQKKHNITEIQVFTLNSTVIQHHPDLPLLARLWPHCEFLTTFILILINYFHIIRNKEQFDLINQSTVLL